MTSLTTFNQIGTSQLMDMCAEYREQIIRDHGINLGFTSAFARVFVLARKQIPVANSTVHRDYVNLSVAGATAQWPRHGCAEE